MKRPPLRILLVDPDEGAVMFLSAGLRMEGHDVSVAIRSGEAIDALLLASALDFVIVTLCDEPSLDVVRTASLMVPTPRVIAIAPGPLRPIDAFELGRLGVHELLGVRLPASDLLRLLGQIESTTPPPIYALLARYIGHVSLLGFERDVRRALLLQALERTGGNRQAAARLLRTSRQMIQKAVNDD